MACPRDVACHLCGSDDSVLPANLGLTIEGHLTKRECGLHVLRRSHSVVTWLLSSACSCPGACYAFAAGLA